MLTTPDRPPSILRDRRPVSDRRQVSHRQSAPWLTRVSGDPLYPRTQGVATREPDFIPNEV